MVPSHVTGAGAKSSRSGGAASWSARLADPAILAIVLYTTVAILATVAAYLAIFTQFAGWDDEGTLLVTLDAFVRGDVLYRDIYSPYGPFYYELFGGLFALTGLDVSTDASRSIVVIVWVLTSFLVGVSAQRLTGRLMLGVASMIVAFASLYVMIAEPMHPHGLGVLLVGLFALLAVNGPTRRTLWAGGACGALLAALMLTKLNLGAFAVAAVALAAVMTVGPLHRRRWLRLPVTAAFLALPFLVMARDLSEAWVRDLALLELLAAVAVLVASWPLRPRPADEDAAISRWLLAAAVGFAISTGAILGILMLTGPTLADVYDGVVEQAMRVRDVLITALPLPTAAVDWGVGGVAAAILAVRLRSDGSDAPTVWPALLRAAAGLTIWYSVAHNAPLAFNPSAGNPITLPLVLAWVAAIPPAGIHESTYRRFLRVLLPALAIVETLQVYPVAGSQMGIAGLMFVPVGAICLGDALTSFRAWNLARRPKVTPSFGLVEAVVAAALVVELGLGSIARPAANYLTTYRQQESLPLPGATQLHLPPAEVEIYTRLVGLLHRYRCSDFISYPNVNSLYLWSEIDAPPPQAPGAWVEALDAERQQRVVDELNASPRPCVIRNEVLVDAWLRGEPPPDAPLVRYVFERSRPVARAGDFELFLPRRGA